MKYIVFDMEWNQTMGPCRVLADGRHLTGEIIEIGAVRLSEDFGVEDVFKAVIKPVFYKKMHKKVKELTGIDSAALRGGESFPEAYGRFLAFCGDDFATVTWGECDVPILKENISAHALGRWVYRNYNLQRIYDGSIAHSQKNTALDAAAQALGIVSEAPFHDALNDALATAEICRKIDMAGAVRDYEPSLVSLSELDHIAYEEVYGITDPQALKNHPRVKFTLCPICRRPLPAARFITYGSGKRLAKLTCPEDGSFLLSVRLSKGKNGTQHASKYVYEWTKDTEKLYEERLKHADKKKEAFLAKIRREKAKKK